MKKTNFLIIWIILTASVSMAQDARIYYEGTYYNGPSEPLNIGQVKYIVTDGDELSIRIYNSNAALKATTLDGDWTPREISCYWFIYTERDFPEVFGTNQYEDVYLRVECLHKANTWQELPQPQIFVPFDYSSANPYCVGDPHNLMPLNPGHHMLVLRRAFFWENSEDDSDIHAPYGDIKIGVYNPIVLSYSEEQLVQNRVLWDQGSLIFFKSELPGPIWSGFSHTNPWPAPDEPIPYDEWVDGPFGCFYSNIAVWDWGINPNPNDSVGIIVSEADVPDAFMGKSQFPITPSMEGPILVKAWGFGWVVLENIWVPSSGKEPSVAQGNVYWYGGWNGLYPADVYGPTNPAVPDKRSYGSQFKPFTNDLFWSFHNNSSFDGYTVGLLGKNFPKCTLNRPRIYKAIDNPVMFGAQ